MIKTTAQLKKEQMFRWGMSLLILLCVFVFSFTCLSVAYADDTNNIYDAGDESHYVDGGIITQTTPGGESGYLTEERIQELIELEYVPKGTFEITYVVNALHNNEVYYTAAIRNNHGNVRHRYLKGLSARLWEQEQMEEGSWVVASVADILFNQTLSDEVSAISQALAHLVTGIGAVLVLVYTVFAILKEFQRGNGSLNMWVMAFVRFLVGLALVIYVDNIMDFISELGLLIVTETQNALTAGFGAGALADSFRTGSTSSSFMVNLMGLLVRIYIRIVSYSLLIELMIRKIMTPIAIASIVSEGARSPGFRWLKKILAVYLKMAILLLCVGLAWYLSTTQGGGLTTILIYIAAMGFMGKGATLADQILGVDRR